MDKKDSKDSTEYERSLTNTHIQLIALGGTIGTGLFLGVGNSIQKAGPSVILIYLIVGIFLFFLMRALGELIISDLSKHSYIEFIEKYLGKDTGFITGYLYWICLITLAMAEMTALGIYFQYWFPHLPTWVPGLVTIAVLLGINMLSARLFGNLEFSFAIIKIVTVVAFVILVAYLMITGKNTTYGAVSFGNLFNNGGFFAKGGIGFLSGFQMVIFSFVGIELLGFTASEAQNPKKTISKAINEVPTRIILFYVLAIVAILVVIPWNKVSTSSSPFVQTLAATGIHNAGSLINFVVISAAISSTNSVLYSAGRLLFSITFNGKGKWNQTFGHLHRQLPQNGLILSACLIELAPLLIIMIGNDAFTFISSTTTSMFLIIWCIMLLSHVAYRKTTPEDQLTSFKMPGFPYFDYATLVFFILMIILLLVLPENRVAMISALAIFIILYAIAKLWRKEKAE
ncbi:amino acid permease [Lactobacillus sp. ESL0703]|uniref:amino acid permease n=1 Tax=Lactobacillus sp. ESL0703 TaxID=2983218 RepID=UPI0023F63E6B|nr:amino acid permease [Lactobacillus sp. ESL0703]MDF7669474.1 amino acid permease [Lactobacillus sp. ESL0703]